MTERRENYGRPDPEDALKARRALLGCGVAFVVVGGVLYVLDQINRTLQPAGGNGNTKDGGKAEAIEVKKDTLTYEAVVKILREKGYDVKLLAKNARLLETKNPLVLHRLTTNFPFQYEEDQKILLVEGEDKSERELAVVSDNLESGNQIVILITDKMWDKEMLTSRVVRAIKISKDPNKAPTCFNLKDRQTAALTPEMQEAVLRALKALPNTNEEQPEKPEGPVPQGEQRVDYSIEHLQKNIRPPGHPD